MPASVRRLQRLELLTPDLARATRFYTEVWGLQVVREVSGARVDLAAASGRPGFVSLVRAQAAALGRVSFAVDSAAEVDALATRVAQAGGSRVRPAQGGGGTYGFEAEGPEALQIGVEFAPAAPALATLDPSKPCCLTHVVLNTTDVAAQTAFFTAALGFRVSDVTARMTFMRCGLDHHSIALAAGDRLSLNHAAFEMTDIDGLMYGAGRLIEHGHPIEWGPGRHGPGDNVFCYFVDPDGFAVEYTTGMEQVDEASHVARDAAYWDAFPRRPCRWGVARKPSERLAAAFSAKGLAG